MKRLNLNQLGHAGPRPLGYTSGVFDYFHIGHANYLTLCKSFCATLIVGVDVDEWVAANKGQRRPVEAFADRVNSVGRHGAADCVIEMNHSNDAILQELKPQFYFVPENRIVSAVRLKLLRVLSVELVIVPYTHGISTSQLTGVRRTG